MAATWPRSLWVM